MRRSTTGGLYRDETSCPGPASGEGGGGVSEGEAIVELMTMGPMIRTVLRSVHHRIDAFPLRGELDGITRHEGEEYVLEGLRQRRVMRPLRTRPGVARRRGNCRGNSVSIRIERSTGVVLVTNMVMAWDSGMGMSALEAIDLHRLANATKSSSGFIFSATKSGSVGTWVAIYEKCEMNHSETMSKLMRSDAESMLHVFVPQGLRPAWPVVPFQACSPLRVAFGGSLVRSPSRQAVVLFRSLVHLCCTLLSFGACVLEALSFPPLGHFVLAYGLWLYRCRCGVAALPCLGPSKVGVLSSTSIVVSVPVWLHIFEVVSTLVPALSPVCAWRVCCQCSLVLRVCVVLVSLEADGGVSLCHVVERVTPNYLWLRGHLVSLSDHEEGLDLASLGTGGVVVPLSAPRVAGVSRWFLGLVLAGYPFPLSLLFIPFPSSPALGRLPSGDPGVELPVARGGAWEQCRGARRRWSCVMKALRGFGSS
ncbi:hypothetical protein Taro_012077 [Colocasia esculenta]|uniref:Uncharacterized protein n=1 Tax=Colocasia esculenta TaxID=4460 RepID=A0A843U329_COLES|nr:hypothetical protein [Colocasia esculenta]